MPSGADALGCADQQVAFGEIAIDVGREEELAVVVADGRLVAAQQLDVSRGPLRLLEDHLAGLRATGPRNTSRTARWFR